MPYGRRRSALMAARPLVRNWADEPQRAGPAPNAQPPGHGCPDFRALCDRFQQSLEHLPARVTPDREAWSAVVSNLALQRSLPLLSGGLPGAIRPVRSFDESAVFSDRPTEVPGGLVTRLNFQRVGIVPLSVSMPCMPHEHPHCHRRHQPASKARSGIMPLTPMAGVSDDLLYDHAAV